MIKPIGGFFELEIPGKVKNIEPSGLCFTNARSSLAFLVDYLKPVKIYFPSFTCGVIFDPIKIRNIEIEFLQIDKNFEFQNLPILHDSELICYVNYFGLKTKYLDYLEQKYKQKLVIDNTHGFFYKYYSQSWSFNSFRKFFGVPDGSYLLGPEEVFSKADNLKENLEVSFEHLIQRYLGNVNLGYKYFLEYERKLNSEIKLCSQYSLQIVKSLDYNNIIHSRQSNFNFLNENLFKHNELKWNLNMDEIPFSYPFLPQKYIERKSLIEKEVFIPVLWPDVLERCEQNTNEYYFAQNILHLPIDHRYTIKEMEYILDIIKPLI